MILFLKTIESDNDSDKNRASSSFYINIKEFRKNIISVERSFNCWIDSLHENCTVTISFNRNLPLSFEQQN